MSKDQTTLLPCPFCGGEAHFDYCNDPNDDNCGGKWIECQNCHCSTNIHFPLMEDVEPLLAEVWNRRV